MLREQLKDILRPLATRWPIRELRELIPLVEACKYRDRRVWDVAHGNERVYAALASGQPQAIGKIGSVELSALRMYLRSRNHHSAPGQAAELRRKPGVSETTFCAGKKTYAGMGIAELRRGKSLEERTALDRRALYRHAGVFPDDYPVFERFSQVMLEEILPEITLMAVWFNPGEAKIVRDFSPEATRIAARGLETYYVPQRRWTSLLEGKRVLVIHPFVNSIRAQYEKRVLIWRGREDVLPQFDLLQIGVPQRPALVAPVHKDWFAALEDLKQQMSQENFDIALIGAGAYSLPLAVHAKKLGRVGIHLGGCLQIQFGIKGRRWRHHPVISKLFNEHWIHPLPEETPANNTTIEDGCYW